MRQVRAHLPQAVDVLDAMAIDASQLCVQLFARADLLAVVAALEPGDVVEGVVALGAARLAVLRRNHRKIPEVLQHRPSHRRHAEVAVVVLLGPLFLFSVALGRVGREHEIRFRAVAFVAHRAAHLVDRVRRIRAQEQVQIGMSLQRLLQVDGWQTLVIQIGVDPSLEL